MGKVKAIAESINIMGKRSGQAMRDRLAQPITEMAKEQEAAGASYLDLNIGPARKDGEELMPWLVESVQSVCNLPLCLDTSNIDAMAAGLKLVKNKEAAIMNSISAQPERAAKLAPLAAEHGCQAIALLWGAEGMPRDENERAAMAVDIMMAATEQGIENERLLFDPIATPINLGAEQLNAGLMFLSMLQEIAPGAGSTIGLSNVSNGVDERLRKYLDRTYLLMLMKHGLSTAIVNCYDPELMAICRGERPEFERLIHGMMDGDIPDPARLSPSELEHFKTYRVLSGEIVFSESWLEL